MNKILVIVGPTSSGKTSLGIELAKRFNGEIVSADSRQVYKKLDIGTGKDLPTNSEFTFVSRKLGGYFDLDGIKIWGYDLVKPDEDFSISKYIKSSRNIIKDISQRGKLPIIAGGTGFYVKGVVDGIETAMVPKNESLRETLKNLNADELFERLANIDPPKASDLNRSDRNNPRRLIRAIEIAQWRVLNKELKKIKKLDADVFFIGLFINKDMLDDRIMKRINKRLEKGFEKEIEKLLLSGIGWKNQSMQALGYRQWQDYLKGKISRSQAIENWYNAEKNYAKKQMVWFKKDKRINWFDVNKEKWEEEVVQLVNKWINDSN